VGILKVLPIVGMKPLSNAMFSVPPKVALPDTVQLKRVDGFVTNSSRGASRSRETRI